MNANINDTITLDDNNKYLIVSKVIYEQETYVYVVNINIPSELKILKSNLENNKLIEIKDSEVIKILIPLFFEEASKSIDIETLIKEIEEDK